MDSLISSLFSTYLCVENSKDTNIGKNTLVCYEYKDFAEAVKDFNKICENNKKESEYVYMTKNFKIVPYFMKKPIIRYKLDKIKHDIIIHPYEYILTPLTTLYKYDSKIIYMSDQEFEEYNKKYNKNNDKNNDKSTF